MRAGSWDGDFGGDIRRGCTLEVVVGEVVRVGSSSCFDMGKWEVDEGTRGGKGRQCYAEQEVTFWRQEESKKSTFVSPRSTTEQIIATTQNSVQLYFLIYFVIYLPRADHLHLA